MRRLLCTSLATSHGAFLRSQALFLIPSVPSISVGEEGLAAFTPSVPIIMSLKKVHKMNEKKRDKGTKGTDGARSFHTTLHLFHIYSCLLFIFPVSCVHFFSFSSIFAHHHRHHQRTNQVRRPLMVFFRPLSLSVSCFLAQSTANNCFSVHCSAGCRASRHLGILRCQSILTHQFSPSSASLFLSSFPLSLSLLPSLDHLFPQLDTLTEHLLYSL